MRKEPQKILSEQPLAIDVERFVTLYVLHGDALTAYDEAYPEQKSLAKNERRMLATALAKRKLVRQEIRKLRDEIHNEFVLTQQEALHILSDLARADLSTALNDDGTFDPKKLKALGRAIQTIVVRRTERGEDISVKMHDPKQAVAQIAQQLAWNAPNKHELTERVTFELNLGGPVIDTPNTAKPAQIEESI